jgi:hypothetical protein
MTSANNISVRVDDHTQIGVGAAPGSSSAGIKVNRDGVVRVGENNAGTTPTYVDAPAVEWATPKGAAVGDGFEVILATISGTLSVGTADVYQALTADRTYEVSQTGAGVKTFTGTMRIRPVGGGADLDTAAISLQATVV